jgi:hypothetical protein
MAWRASKGNLPKVGNSFLHNMKPADESGARGLLRKQTVAA